MSHLVSRCDARIAIALLISSGCAPPPAHHSSAGGEVVASSLPVVTPAARVDEPEALAARAEPSRSEPVAEVGLPIDLGCGRWTANLPEGMTATGNANNGYDVFLPCTVDVYGSDPRAVSGVHIAVEVQAGACAIGIRGWDAAPTRLASDPAEVVVEHGREGQLLLRALAADGAAMSLTFSASPTCAASAQSLADGLARTLLAVPLGGGDVHLPISSRGHGIDLHLPDGVFAVLLVPSDDAYQAAFELRARDGRALVTIYAAEDRAIRRPFRPAILRRVVPVTEEERALEPVELSDRCEPTARADTEADRGLGVSMFFCGDAEENAQMEAVLRAGRFTPAWAGR